ncbi:7,8-dihydro-6-hydroxymethylpterin-pyrophosphokinase [Gallibacterium genomosp. 3]|uniref:2-amino-4-hydroxy-6-hydroxymethyldihydropteridine pyrophosphokinase n=1 Tax=Gallibacterium genomosp. 3 TaxID=505345 RepID=A0A1A7PRW9_9PAST|nr:2-amino-4-hydroxy-6-hydroxymethyldihydropteridine diphosphokinase [Gallibacterium genomosp. 3]OBW91585.1 7,8-dihydro-6-hydroxymethylpterin-pyrophosphokinase [Gallibacterium genomosp. 3]OBX04799.1 7,8-dihydro-6-hydroxymethylpterin-pyrophosphokinase [Gallibacterium genomosp. 3]OBX11051.1 7,8-dihydro-6-hydroxymethylpterin-pyrophosphokinase [Gallibacterium genomosp. 3]
MNNVYIALGSNLNQPILQLTTALDYLQQQPAIQLIAVSPLYSSKPLGPQDQPDYVNAVAQIQTSLEPLALLDLLQAVEQQQGRVRLRRWGERTLDLDILLFNQEIIDTERLTVPHKEMKNREFVLIPLFDIAPQLILPDGESLATAVMPFRQHTMQRVAQYPLSPK